jgi:hypothetical protein
MREDMYAQSALASFYLDTTRERILSGSTHRYQLGKLQSIHEITYKASIWSHERHPRSGAFRFLPAHSRYAL